VTSQPPPYPGGSSDPGGPGGPDNSFGNMPPYAYGGYGSYGGPTPPAGPNGMAIAALVLGIVSIPGGFTVWIGLIAGVLGIVFGIIGLRRASQPGGRGKGMAVAGLATGVVGLVLSIVVGLFIVNELGRCRDQLGPGATPRQLSDCITNNISR